MQWARGQSDRGKRAPIVILSNRDKADLDKMVGRIRTQTGLDVQAREGRPECPEDLRLVSAQHASNIIVMDPHYGEDRHAQVGHMLATLQQPPLLPPTAPFILVILIGAYCKHAF